MRRMKVLFVNLVYGIGSTGKIIADIMNLLKKYVPLFEGSEYPRRLDFA